MKKTLRYLLAFVVASVSLFSLYPSIVAAESTQSFDSNAGVTFSGTYEEEIYAPDGTNPEAINNLGATLPNTDQFIPQAFLPQTGEENHISFLLAGSLMIIIASTIILVGRKNKVR